MERILGSKWFGSRPRPLALNLYFLTLVILMNCDISGYANGQRVLKRVPRQLGLGFGGFGTNFLASLQPHQQQHQQHQYNTRQPSHGSNFFNTMMRMNFDMTEVVAMYRNVTATAETPGCLGHCRTPMALWVVQSFYPCYSLKKADCPKGQVCCVDDPAQRIASPNSIHDTRGKIKPHHQSLASAIRDRNQGHYLHPKPPPTSSEDSAAQPSSSSAQKASPSVGPTPEGATQSTTLFDEEYMKNNFIQDELPE